MQKEQQNKKKLLPRQLLVLRTCFNAMRMFHTYRTRVVKIFSEMFVKTPIYEIEYES